MQIVAVILVVYGIALLIECIALVRYFRPKKLWEDVNVQPHPRQDDVRSRAA